MERMEERENEKVNGFYGKILVICLKDTLEASPLRLCVIMKYVLWLEGRC